jgi:hypothetical protein
MNNDTRKRSKAIGEVVGITLRLTRHQWERVHKLSVKEGVSIQQLSIEGLSLIFKKKGESEL